MENSRITALEKEGWTKRFVACEPRLSEAADLYRGSGFEVLLEPLHKGSGCNDCRGEGEGTCRVCFDGHEGLYRVILTRPSAQGHGITCHKGIP